MHVSGMRSLGMAALASLSTACAAQADVGSVIFIHPDGMSGATWGAVRAALVGPDAELEWDRLPSMALYREHMLDTLTATSNGGGTTHAYGVKVMADAYGRTAAGAGGQDIVDERGESLSVAKRALREGLGVGLVQSGTTTEPGTGCFLASVDRRSDHDTIAAQLVGSGAQVILGGGERWMLPAGEKGLYGVGERKDGRNLLEEARAQGYTVVRTRAELLALPEGTEKVLGVFAWVHTFNDMPEEKLAERGLALYDPEAPTLEEMTGAALRVLAREGRRFLLVVEEEGTDNFGNCNNAKGVLEAARRADETIALARGRLAEHPNTLVMVASDSDAGGMRLVGVPFESGKLVDGRLPAKDANGAPIDGAEGTGTKPFVARPDRFGNAMPFAVVWAAMEDVSGGVLVRAEGLNSELVRGSFDNTEIARVIRATLFGGASAGE